MPYRQRKTDMSECQTEASTLDVVDESLMDGKGRIQFYP